MGVFNKCCLHSTLVEHSFTGSYLLKTYGAHYRKYLRILSKKFLRAASSWTGADVCSSPIVSLAPPNQPPIKT